jgi:uncharacterized protein YyaL (SSP411 family)
MPRTVEFALVRARDQATRTLDAVQTHLLDTYDGGFYRYATNRNWRSAVREKLTDENAALVRAFAHGYRYTGDENYRESAERTIEYLTTTLWTADDTDPSAGGAFAASQGGDEEYYRLEPSDREAADEPPIDDTVFADRNGLAIDALLTYAAYTDDDRARSYAERARDHVTEALVTDGEVAHYGGPDAPSGLLLDHARLFSGLTTSWQVLGEAGPAREIADWAIEHLRDQSGAFCDGPVGGPGLLDSPLYPLDTTVEFADELLTLSLLTGEDRYRTTAREAVDAYGGAAERMGVEVAHYAATAARLLVPQAIEVGTPAGTDLHRAALRLADHDTVVVPDADCEGARLVVDGTVEGNADTPAGLEAVVTGDGA